MKIKLVKKFCMLQLLMILMAMVFTEILRLPACSKFDGEFSVRGEGRALINSLLLRVQGISYFECLYKCVRHRKCKSINYSEKKGECELNSRTSKETKGIQEVRHGWSFYETPQEPVKNLGPVCQQTSPCMNGKCTDICEDPGYICTCDDGYVGSRCELLAGLSAEAAGSSCLDIRNRYGRRKPPSGMYWVKAQDPARMFCEMDVDGGGWTKVANMNITSNEYQFSPSNVFDDVGSLGLVERPYYALSTQGLAKLRVLIGFNSIRIRCYKPSANRTIHIATVNNRTGLAVVDYMTGASTAYPISCGFYVAYPDDDSVLSKSCSRWFNSVWSDSRANKTLLLYDLTAFITMERRIVTGSFYKRFECDDDNQREKRGSWMFFVR